MLFRTLISYPITYGVFPYLRDVTSSQNMLGMHKGGFVYIMSNRYRNVLYIGVTADLKKRIWEHRGHLFKQSFTDKYNVESLLYYELFDLIEDAIKREKQLKRWSRQKKEDLIKIKNPEKTDLYDEVANDIYSL